MSRFAVKSKKMRKAKSKSGASHVYITVRMILNLVSFSPCFEFLTLTNCKTLTCPSSNVLSGAFSNPLFIDLQAADPILLTLLAVTTPWTLPHLRALLF